MLQRMLIDKIENRILVGITAFVGVMILVGWVAINENARMAASERQFLARSIERGAELFAANCSTCHGNDGRGLLGRAPGLNSPHFFGFDYFAEIDGDLDAIARREAELNAELDALRAELVAPGTTDARQAEIFEIRDQITAEISELQAEVVALEEQKLDLYNSLIPAVDAGYPLMLDSDGNVTWTDANADGTPDGAGRLDQINWGGTLYDFTFTTLVHGRPTSVSYWEGNQMVAWSQRANGPLRDDQLDDLTNFILNWDKGSDWTVEDALAVRQYAIVPGLGGGSEEMADPAGADVDAILQTIADEGVVGDPVRGAAIYNNTQPSQLNSRLGCAGCHGANAGPATEETWDNFFNVRVNETDVNGVSVADHTVEQYLVESIVAPGAYVVNGWADGQMPNNFATRMSVQDIADVVAYLRTYGTINADPAESSIPSADGDAAAEGEGE